MFFMPGRGTLDAIFILQQMLQQYDMAGRKLYIVIVKLEKAFDHVPKNVAWWAFRKKDVMERKVLAIEKMY